jgi:hypothetical protein
MLLNMPDTGSMDMAAILSLLQVPPVVASASVDVNPEQIAVRPVITDNGLTTTVVVDWQPEGNV